MKTDNTCYRQTIVFNIFETLAIIFALKKKKTLKPHIPSIWTGRNEWQNEEMSGIFLRFYYNVNIIITIPDEPSEFELYTPPDTKAPPPPPEPTLVAF